MVFPNEYSGLILVGILTLVIVLKLLMPGHTILGKCSGRARGDKTTATGEKKSLVPGIIGHAVQGIIAGILISPLNLYTKNAEWWYWFRNALIAIFIIVYPYYNILKRGNKQRVFYESSFYLNMTDFIVGVWIGIAIGFGCQQIPSQKALGPFIINDIFYYVILSLLIIWSFIAIILTVGTRNKYKTDAKANPPEGNQLFNPCTGKYEKSTISYFPEPVPSKVAVPTYTYPEYQETNLPGSVPESIPQQLEKRNYLIIDVPAK